jgi:NitT/TauT family transport system ATP-binding protein
MQSTAFLEMREVTKHYKSRAGTKTVLDRFSLRINSGDKIALLGANGSGKTTLLRLILGVTEPTFGSIIRDPTAKGRSAAYVPQDYRQALFPWFSLEANLGLARSGRPPGSRRESELRHLEQFHCLCEAFKIHLDLRKFPYELSGGEQQIFLLIRSMLSNPAAIVLDEPLSAVDFARKRLIQNLLGTWLIEHDSTLIFASHDYEEAVLLANRVLVLANKDSCKYSELPIALSWPRTFEMRYLQVFRQALDQITSEVLR